MSLGQRLAEKRNEVGLSQTELAKKINTSPTMISLYESNDRKPSYRKLELISHHLNTTVDYLMSGKSEVGTDPLSKKIILSLRYLSPKQRTSIFDFICQNTGTGNFNFDIPVCNSAVECAESVLRKIGIEPPVDPFKIAMELGVELLNVNKHAEYQGLLIKTGEMPIVVLDSSVKSKERKAFTLAMMLGHLVMPWHLSGKFGREHGEISSEVTDIFSIESREFATELLIPKKHLEKDVKALKSELTYKKFCEIASNKYNISTTSFIKRYLSFTGDDKIVFLRCHEGIVQDNNGAGFPYQVIEIVHPETFAGRLMNNPPSESTTLSGKVNPSLWLADVQSDIALFEESFVDPEYGWVMTLLRIV